MSSADKKEEQKASARMKTYFIIALLLLFLMAFLSSLGNTFLYILGGLSFFFSFLAWQNWRATLRAEDFTHYNRSERGNSFTDTIRSTFRGQGKRETTASPAAASLRRVLLIIASFIGGIFTLIILIIIFTSGSDDSSESQTFDASEMSGSGDNESAYAGYRRAIADNPSDASAYYGLGSIKSNVNERDSALYYYSKALEVDPQLYDAAYAKALIYFNEQNYAQSNVELKYILDKTDQHVNAYLLAGDNHYFANDYDPAIGYYEKAYQLGARSKELSNIMAYIYDVRGDQSRAIEYYKETLQFDSTMTEVYKRLGELMPGEEGSVFRRKAEQQW